MNKAFRVLWNSVRRMYVVASEITGCGQSCGSAVSKQKRFENLSKNLVDEQLISVKSAAIISFIFGTILTGFPDKSLATTYSIPTNCATLGGTLNNGVCTMDSLNIRNSNGQFYGWNNNLTLTSGDLLVVGRTQNVIPFPASTMNSSAATSTWQNTGSGTLTIKNEGWRAIEYGSQCNGRFYVKNTSTGTITIEGSSNGYAISSMMQNAAGWDYPETLGLGTLKKAIFSDNSVRSP